MLILNLLSDNLLGQTLSQHKLLSPYFDSYLFWLHLILRMNYHVALADLNRDKEIAYRLTYQ